MVTRVGQRLASTSGKAELEWQFVLVADAKPNAFCLPGGKIAVTEGLLPICHNEAGLAAAMSHEMGHMLARHGEQRMTRRKAGGLLAALAPPTAESPAERFESAYAMSPEARSRQPYSKEENLEADSIGLQLMAKSGYDPREAPRYWERWEQSEAQILPDPAQAGARINEIQKMVPTAVSYYNQSKQHGLGMMISPIPRTSPAIQLASHETQPRQTAKPVQTASAADSSDPFLAAPVVIEKPVVTIPTELPDGIASIDDLSDEDGALPASARMEKVSAVTNSASSDSTSNPEAERAGSGWKGGATTPFVRPVPLEGQIDRVPRPKTVLSETPVSAENEHPWRAHGQDQPAAASGF